MPSSVQLYSQTISDFKRLQDILDEKQAKIGADSKASTFSELGDDLTQVQSLKLSIERSGRYIDSIKQASTKNDVMYQSISSIIAVAQQFQQNLAAENSSTSAPVNNLSTEADSALDNIRDMLNAQSNGTYVFSGAKTDQQPVVNLKSATNVSNGQATANYYKGDNFQTSVDVSNSLRVTYGVDASNPAFAQLIGAINMAKDVETNGGDYTAAGNMLQTALSSLTSLQTTVSDNAKIFQNSQDYQTTAQSTFQQNYDDLNSPDVVQLTVEASQAQATLEASFTLFSRLSQLSLTNYL